MDDNIDILSWYKEILGPMLLQCNGTADKGLELHPIEAVLDMTVGIVGLYFTHIFIFNKVKAISEQVLDLYKMKNNMNNCKSSVVNKKMEIIQVVLTPSVYGRVHFPDSEENSDKLLKDFPWLAMAHEEIRRKAWLSSRFNVMKQVTTLVLLEAKTGLIITKNGVTELENDPEGNNFPWRPQPIYQLLEECPLISGNDEVSPVLPKEGMIGIYVSAEWSTKGCDFIPKLVSVYKKIKQRGLNFEIVFVSMDSDEEDFLEHFSGMPWLAVPYRDKKLREELCRYSSMDKLPCLTMIDGTGRVVAENCFHDIEEDTEGMNFPWHLKLVNSLMIPNFGVLAEHPAIILFFENEEDRRLEETILVRVAEDHRRKYSSHEDVPFLRFFFSCDPVTNECFKESTGFPAKFPQLVAFDAMAEWFSVFEEDITTESVKNFVRHFLDHNLHMNHLDTS